ncbi:MAG: hypothetical protein HQL41_15335 [Alphaproteobacteria bacterium]|nr:hypothetical protein [Alphaproteobacteria bacterium]
MKKLVAILVLLLLIGVGVIAGMAFAGIEPVASMVRDKIPGAAKFIKAPEEKENKPAAPALPKYSYVEMETLQIPVISNDGGPIRQLFLELRIEVPLGRAPEMSEAMPRLQHAFIKDMHVFLPWHMRGREVPDLTLVKRRLKLVSDKVVGPQLATDVLIRAVVER